MKRPFEDAQEAEFFRLTGISPSNWREEGHPPSEAPAPYGGQPGHAQGHSAGWGRLVRLDEL